MPSMGMIGVTLTLCVLALADSATADGKIPPGTVRVAEYNYVNLDENPQTITFTQPFNDPVVVMRPPSFNNFNIPCKARISNVTRTGFIARLEKTASITDTLVAERVSWLAVERGTWTLTDGNILMADTISAVTLPAGKSNGQWPLSYSFRNSYVWPTVPVVVTQLQTRQTTFWVHPRVTGISKTLLLITLELDFLRGYTQKLAYTPGEDIGYVAMTAGSFSRGEITALTGVTSNWKTVTFAKTYTGYPHFFAQVSSNSLKRPSDTRQSVLGTASARVKIEEDTEGGNPGTHTTPEAVGLFVLDSSFSTLVITGNCTVGSYKAQPTDVNCTACTPISNCPSGQTVCTGPADQSCLACSSGYSGAQCNICSTGYYFNSTISQCLDINDCASSPCLNGATCTNYPGPVYTCRCADGYGGVNCSVLCSSFTPSCSSCNDTGFCARCVSDRYLTSNGTCVSVCNATNVYILNFTDSSGRAGQACQNVLDLSSDPCTAYTTCQACNTAAALPQCGWCENFPGYGAQCVSNTTGAALCASFSNTWVYFQSSIVTFVAPTLNGSLSQQLSPDTVRINLRPNQPISFPVIVQRSSRLPLDLYLIMDESGSFADDIDTFSSLALQFPTILSSVSDSWTIGFGAFIEKNVDFFMTGPYTSRGSVVYSYKHVVSLTNNVTTYNNAINAQYTRGNSDWPEGGTDAMGQAMSCLSMVGWRNDSRKIMVFASDAGFKTAMHGKVSGLVDPYVDTCNMVKNYVDPPTYPTGSFSDGYSYYLGARSYDYPSAGFLKAKLQALSIVPILAINTDAGDEFDYRYLLAKWGFGEFAYLQQDSSNLLDLISTAYANIQSTIRLYTSATGYPQYVSSIVRPYFTDPVVAGLPQAAYTDVQADDQATFIVTLLATSYDNVVNVPVVLGVDGLNEAIDLTVTVSFNCSGLCKTQNIGCVSGTWDCGKCICLPNYIGATCNCHSTNNAASDCPLWQGQVCNNRGNCQCSQCVCLQADPSAGRPFGYSGTACECVNSCLTYNGLECNAPHGSCSCGVCSCAAGWTGQTCECNTAPDSCVIAGETNLCNGHGSCSCGECVCTDGYTGSRCSVSPNVTVTTPNPCAFYTTCGACLLNNNSNVILNINEACFWCSSQQLCVVDIPEFLDSCPVYLNSSVVGPDACIIVQSGSNTPTGPLIGGIVGGLVGLAVLAILLFLLITNLADRREWARFNREREKSRWAAQANPIYQASVKEFTNPIYSGEAAH